MSAESIDDAVSWVNGLSKHSTVNQVSLCDMLHKALKIASVCVIIINIIIITEFLPRVGPGHPSSPLSIYFFIFHPLLFFFFIGFTYFLLLSIPSLSTRIVPLRFQAGGRRR